VVRDQIDQFVGAFGGRFCRSGSIAAAGPGERPVELPLPLLRCRVAAARPLAAGRKRTCRLKSGALAKSGNFHDEILDGVDLGIHLGVDEFLRGDFQSRSLRK